MSAFLSGADKGPTNPLRSVTGRLEIDRSIFQDRLISRPNVAGPSRVAGSESRSTPQVAQTQSRGPFDLSDLRNHLSPSPQSVASPAPQFQSERWSEGFVPSARAAGKQRAAAGPSPWQEEYSRSVTGSAQPVPQAHWQRTQSPQYMPAGPSWNYPKPEPFYHPPPMPSLRPQEPQPMREVRQQEQSETQRSQSAPPKPLNDAQEILAQTAQTFVEDLGQSSLLKDNPKLAQSRFMELVTAVGRKEVIVQEPEGPMTNGEEVGRGATFIERPSADWAADFTSNGVKPAFLETAHGPLAGVNPLTYPSHAASFAPTLGQVAVQNGVQSSDPLSRWEEEFAEASSSTAPAPQRRKSVHFADANAQTGSMDQDFDQETFADFHGQMRQARTPRLGVGAFESWEELQKDREELHSMDHWPAQMRGMGTGDQAERYLFQSSNPYTAGVEIEGYRQESPTSQVGPALDQASFQPSLPDQGVLELEAAVQADPTNHQAWYTLGLKQQENEREDQAILALAKAIQLDPNHRPTYLALAVSYTNEGDQGAANVMLEKWIDLGVGIVDLPLERREGEGLAAERKRLTGRLIDAARRNPDKIDAGVQIALGVLFNSSEEYGKAEDCFQAALSARPDDWLLYNRLGATLANSGRSNEAISYYHKALSLHPNFVRALFNLGIAHVNLAQYAQAAQRILDALRLQHADATEGYANGSGSVTSPKGLTSNVLWTTLRNVAMHMGRHDYVELASLRDLAGFPSTVEDSDALEQQPTQ